MNIVLTRATKQAARYTDAGTRAEHCARCRFFLPQGTCGRIIGPVSPQGWCKYFSQEMVQRSQPGSTLGSGGSVASLDIGFYGPPLDPRITFTRASTATYFDATGTMQTAATNAARFDYNPQTLALNGLLIEEARTNIWLASGDASNAVWGATGGGSAPPPTVTGNQSIAPNGTTTAARVAYPSVPAGTNASNLTQSAAVTANAYSFSVWLKGNVGGEQLYLAATPDAVTWYRTLATLTTAWQRFTLTTPALTAATWYFQLGFDLRDPSQSTKPASTIFVWGGQLEQGTFATSYIPTTTVPVTRSPDLVSMPTAAWFATTSGTYQGEFIPNGNAAGLPTVISGNAGSPVIATGADSRLVASIRSGASIFSATGPLFTFGAVNKAAFAYLSGASTAAVNGTTIGPSATVLSVTGTSVEFGSDGVTPGNNALDGWLRRVRYWPRVLSNAELQSITT
jgi:hypothetical protein